MDHRTQSRPSRRRFVQGVGVVGLALLAGCGRLPWQASPLAQPLPRLYRIGLLHDAAPNALEDPHQAAAALLQELRELGYVEGHNVTIEARYTAGSPEQLASSAAELAHLPADVLATGPSSATRAARTATSTIPIVNLFGSTDLVRAGLAASQARPGGNVTGLSNYGGDELGGKLLELLKEVAPAISRAAVVTPNPEPDEAERQAAARALGIGVQAWRVRGLADLDAALEAITRGEADGLVVVASPWTVQHRQRIVDFAAERRLPAIYGGIRWFTDAGGLMGYWPSQADNYRRAATFVDKILRGASPADLPLERPSQFDFIINLKTAQAQGLTIPPHVLLQATEVIQ